MTRVKELHHDFLKVTVKKDGSCEIPSRMKSFFETTEKEYCRALLKIKLFSKEAKDAKIDLETEIAAELEQMINQKLSQLYITRLLETYKLQPGTVESYYDSHLEEFTGKNETPPPLDENLYKKIRQNIMKIKRSEIANKEMARLMKKYHIEILNPVCSDKKGSSNE